MRAPDSWLCLELLLPHLGHVCLEAHRMDFSLSISYFPRYPWLLHAKDEVLWDQPTAYVLRHAQHPHLDSEDRSKVEAKAIASLGTQSSQGCSLPIRTDSPDVLEIDVSLGVGCPMPG